MTELFGIIEKYKSQLTMLPTMVIIFVTATLLCYIVLSRVRWLKYLPALFGISLGIFQMFSASKVFTGPDGLPVMWRGVYLFVSGCIALGTAWIIALLSGKPKKRKQRRIRARRVSESRSTKRSVSDDTKRF